MTTKTRTAGEAGEREFLTMTIAGQLFGVEVSEIREVFQLVSLGVYRLDGRLLVALDVERLLDFGSPAAVAA